MGQSGQTCLRGSWRGNPPYRQFRHGGERSRPIALLSAQPLAVGGKLLAEFPFQGSESPVFGALVALRVDAKILVVEAFHHLCSLVLERREHVRVSVERKLNA